MSAQSEWASPQSLQPLQAEARSRQMLCAEVEEAGLHLSKRDLVNGILA